jgi:uncharacterized protein
MSMFIRSRAPVLRRLLTLSLAVCGIAASGCTSQAERERTKELLAKHPGHETRMSAGPAEGYTPTGVWRVRGERCMLYLAGTCHMVTDDQIPFPSPFYAAYEDSKEVYLEVEGEPSGFAMLRLTFKMLKWADKHGDQVVCPKGHTIEDYLAADTVEKLKAHYGKVYRRRRKMTPLWMAFIAQLESYGAQYEKNSGVDEVFMLRARKDRKRVHALDDKSVDDVVVLVMDEMLATLQREIAERGPDGVICERILGENEEREDDAGWRHGDLAAIERDAEEMRSESPALYEKIGPERNRKWMEKLKAALRGRKNVIALAGEAHFGGQDGLLQLLQNAGYEPEQLYGVDRPFTTAGE